MAAAEEIVDRGKEAHGPAQGEDEYYLFLSLAEAKVRAAASDSAQALSILHEVLGKTETRGAWLLHAEAELALAEIELDLGKVSEARARLGALATSAHARGWESMAEKARR